MERDLLAKEINESIKKIVDINMTLPFEHQHQYNYIQTIYSLEEMIATAITTAILKYDELKDK